MSLARQWPAARAAAACGLEESRILTFTRWLTEAEPLVLAPGNGLERGRNGGSGIRVAIALPALLGKLGKGSGIVLGASNAFPKTPAMLQRPDLAPAGTRTLNINDIGRHLAEDDIDPPLRALFIYNHNPIVVHPDQNRMRRGLARPDIFAVGIELTMTESMTYCDVVLPAATNFEYADLYPSYGHHWLQRAEAVIPPVGESLPNTEIFRRLAARFGFEEPCFKATDEELMDDAVDAADPPAGGPSTEPDPDPQGAADDGTGWQSAGPLRQHLSRDAVGQDRAQIRDIGQAVGRGGLAAGMARAARLTSPHADFTVFRQAHLFDAGEPRRFAQAAATANEPQGCCAAKPRARHRSTDMERPRRSHPAARGD